MPTSDRICCASGANLLECQRIAKRLGSCVQTEAGGELSSERHDPMVFRVDGDEFGRPAV